MPALPGGKATNDQLEAPKMAVLRRGGRRPQASVSPAARRAPRDLLRRRLPWRRQRAALLAPGQNTTSHYPLPAIGQTSASQATRDRVAERWAAPAVPKRRAVARALLASSERRLTARDRPLVQSAQHHDAPPC